MGYMKQVLAFDLGTGSVKACLFDEEARCLGDTVVAYETLCSADGIRKEQRPETWWQAVRAAAKSLLRGREDTGDIVGIGVSGHSLGAVAVTPGGTLLADTTPIWSDARAGTEAAAFFTQVDHRRWYGDTGCGFPPALYTLFKIMWYQRHEPVVYDRAVFIGSKDYINLRLTGRIATDRSYASGSGAYSLHEQDYAPAYLAAAGIDRAKLPPILESAAVLGTLSAAVARDWGIPSDVAVVGGGVDNACMCLGAGCYRPGQAYVSLGSSAWAAASADRPVFDRDRGMYSFQHCVPGLFVPSAGIYSAGTSLEWMLRLLFPEPSDTTALAAFDRLAAAAPIGANGVSFLPTLAGGAGLSAPDSGGFHGLTLGTSKADLARATLEGIACELRLALDSLAAHIPVTTPLTVVGGGTHSPLWLDIYAALFERDLICPPAGRKAAALGAAALAFRGAGVWPDYSRLETAHPPLTTVPCRPEAAAAYREVRRRFAAVYGRSADSDT